MKKLFASIPNSGSSVFTITEVAQELNCNESAVLSLIESGQLKSITVGGAVKVSKYVLDRFLGNEDSTSVATFVEQQQRIIETLGNFSSQSYTTQNPDVLALLCEDVGDKESDKMAKLGYGQGSCYFSEVRKRFECQFPIVDGGKVKRKLVWGTTEAEAIGKMAVAKQLAAGTLISNQPIIIQTSSPVAPVAEPEPKKHLVNDRIDEYLAHKGEKWEDAVVTNYKYYGSRLKKLFEGEYIEDINTSRIMKYTNKVVIKSTTEDGEIIRYSEQNVKDVNAILKNVLELAVDDGLIPRTPYTKIVGTPKGVESKPKERYLTAEDVQSLKEAVKDNIRYTTIVCVLLGTGLRIGELLALNWKNVDFEKKAIHVDVAVKRATDKKTGKQISKIGKPKTESSIRDVVVDDGVLKVLSAWRDYVSKDKKLSAMIAKNGTADYVMVNDEGNLIKYQTLNNNMKLYLQRRGYSKQSTAHWLRHTFATTLDEAGVDVSVIQSQLGHKDSSTTSEIYITTTKKKINGAIYDKDVRKAMNDLASPL